MKFLMKQFVFTICAVPLITALALADNKNKETYSGTSDSESENAITSQTENQYQEETGAFSVGELGEEDEDIGMFEEGEDVGMTEESEDVAVGKTGDGMKGEGKMKGGKSAATKDVPHLALNFEPNSSNLSDSDKESLRKLISDAKAKGEISEVTIAAWSDKPLPPRGEKLMDNDQELADARAEAIENFLDSELNVAEIDTFNMAESANWVARTFRTEEAELKSIFGRRGADTPLTNQEFNSIRDSGGPSKAVVVVEHKQKGQVKENVNR